MLRALRVSAVAGLGNLEMGSPVAGLRLGLAGRQHKQHGNGLEQSAFLGLARWCRTAPTLDRAGRGQPATSGDRLALNWNLRGQMHPCCRSRICLPLPASSPDHPIAALAARPGMPCLLTVTQLTIVGRRGRRKMRRWRERDGNEVGDGAFWS